MDLRRWWLVGLGGLVLCAGCSQVAVPDNTSEYGVVIFDTTIPELPEKTEWLTSVPGPFVWGAIQRQPDQPMTDWSWQTTDQFIEQAEERNVQVVATLWPYALWDQAHCHGDWPNLVSLFGSQFGAPYPPCDTTAYTTWVTAVVERYGDRVTTWQVLSFPESQTAPLAHFVGSSQAYTELAQVTTATIQTVQPDAQVLSATIGRPNSNTISFWSPILQNGVSDIFTTLAVAVQDESEWQAVQSWLERYTWIGPVWIVQTPERQSFDQAEKVFYTISND